MENLLCSRVCIDSFVHSVICFFLANIKEENHLMFICKERVFLQKWKINRKQTFDFRKKKEIERN